MCVEHYVWRFGRRAMLLDEREWSELEPFLVPTLTAIKDYRAKTGVSLSEAKDAAKLGLLHLPGMTKYEQLTGTQLKNHEELWFVRMADYGSPCPSCKCLRRTPRAKLCVECGHFLPEGKVACLCLPEHISAD